MTCGVPGSLIVSGMHLQNAAGSCRGTKEMSCRWSRQRLIFSLMLGTDREAGATKEMTCEWRRKV